jgi:hypothetical protein
MTITLPVIAWRIPYQQSTGSISTRPTKKSRTYKDPANTPLGKNLFLGVGCVLCRFPK